MELRELVNEYGYNSPIFLEDLISESGDYIVITQRIKRLEKLGSIARYDRGVYYIPQKSELLGVAIVNPEKIIEAKYIKRQGQYFGFFSGLDFANQIGLTT
ncbi:MAG: DUF6088 family protein, partial [Anaerovoracaceae bacterium]